MEFDLSPNLVNEQKALETEIRAAFNGVTRQGGVSWMEAEVIDGYGNAEQRAEARSSEKEHSWEDLINEPDDWTLHMSNWCFLDAIGFRYYLAPAMIKCSREVLGDSLCYALTMKEGIPDDQISLLSPTQKAVVSRFVRFMMAATPEYDREEWEQAYRSHWNRFG